jgi:hypothetical protein
MKSKERSSLARELLGEIKRVQKADHSDGQDLYQLVDRLEKLNLVNRPSEGLDGYVIRMRVSGSPILLDRSNNEISLRDLPFAMSCFEELHEQSEDVSLLQILL